MRICDQENNTLREGDKVAFPMDLGKMAFGHVSKVSSITGPNPNEPPHIFLTITLVLPATPTGIVPGIAKVAQEAKPMIEE